jgi:ribosomal-protein-alanine N-acetyltransferase
VILYEGEVVGQLNISNILYGSVLSGTIGYWVSKDVAGRGIMTSAVAQAIDYAFQELRLHRIEIDIRPENIASLRVVEKLGLRKEGIKQKFIHIDGAWRDHLVFAITKEEVSGSMVSRVSNEHTQKNMEK